MKILVITNIPVPYRIPVYTILSSYSDVELHVAYMAPIEENRAWTLPAMEFDYYILPRTKTIAKKDGFNYIHLNKGVWKHLNTKKPDVVITTGFNPAQIEGWVWTRLKRKKHIAMSDGWLKSETSLSVIHRIVRKVILGNSEAFIGASKQTFKLFEHYGASKEKIVQSALVTNNKVFNDSNLSFKDREYDLIFSGTLLEHKNPDFVVQVARQLVKVRPGLSIVFLGKGPLQAQLEEPLTKLKVTFKFAGHVEQTEIPRYMGNAKIHLFPTLQEAWGIVVNEASAAGTPTISSMNTAAAHEVVLNDETGYALELEVSLWCKRIVELLDDSEKWQSFSSNAIKLISNYTFNAAAKGMYLASKKAME